MSGTSKKIELKLVGVARGSLEELLGDFDDFIRQRGLNEWGKDHPMSRVVRHLAYARNRTDRTYSSFIEYAPPEVVANTMVCIINQRIICWTSKSMNWKKHFFSRVVF